MRPIAALGLLAVLGAAGVAADGGRDAARAEVREAMAAGEAAARDGLDLEARGALERAVAIASERIPGTIDEANALDALAAFHLGAGRAEESIPFFEASLASYRGLLGGTQPRVATSLHNLAVAEWRAARVEAAEARAAEALLVWDRLPPERRSGRDQTLQLLANLARRAGRESDALAWESARTDRP